MTNTRKLLWDEENHLLASCDNGYLTSYYYDAAGERTVKMSGDAEGVFVNGLLSGGRTGTANFTAYLSPYLNVRNGGEYTKHIYMGSQRITSKVSDSGIFKPENNPVKDTLQGKYTAQTAALKMRYDSLGVQYKGVEKSGSINSSSPSGLSASYFYHSDHLGSSSLITDISGEIVQHVEYVPFGGTFIDERRSLSSWHTPFLFSGKERDEETGLLYVSQRYQDEKYGIWYSVDPLAELYPGWSPYVYCLNNPVRFIDPDGRSTHTTKDGNVVAVYQDKDKGVYRHSDEQLKNFDPNKMSLGKVGAEKMGETEHLNEFVNPETGKAMTDYKIQFGKSFDPIIAQMHDLAKGMDLKEIASKSAGGELFDIKKDYPNTGALLNGKYATSRSAGNFLAGYNAESSSYMGIGISFETFQKLAGALHIEESNGKRLSFGQKVDIITLGTYNSSDLSKFKAPTWGEQKYQYRMSLLGWGLGQKK